MNMKNLTYYKKDLCPQKVYIFFNHQKNKKEIITFFLLKRKIKYFCVWINNCLHNEKERYKYF